MENHQTAPILRLDAVTKVFDGLSAVVALRGVSFAISEGERVAIMGPSGSGKSTLLNLICGLDDPSSGSIFFDGNDLAKLNDDKRTRLRREKIGMIFQTFNLLPTLTGIENVALPLRLKGAALRSANEKAVAMLDRVGLSGRKEHRPDWQTSPRGISIRTLAMRSFTFWTTSTANSIQRSYWLPTTIMLLPIATDISLFSMVK